MVTVRAAWVDLGGRYELRAGVIRAYVVPYEDNDGWRWYIDRLYRNSGVRRYPTPERAKTAAERALRRLVSESWRALFVAVQPHQER